MLNTSNLYNNRKEWHHECDTVMSPYPGNNFFPHLSPWANILFPDPAVDFQTADYIRWFWRRLG